MKYRDDLRKPVNHYYLGEWENYKAWQEIQPLSNKNSPGHCRYVLVQDDECTYPQAKWSEMLTKHFFEKITEVCLKFTKSYTNIHYLGLYEDEYVWEVWDVNERSREYGLPHLVIFNGNRYKMVKDRQETLSITEYFLSFYKLSS